MDAFEQRCEADAFNSRWRDASPKPWLLLDADKSSAAGAGDNSEKLILELFDVLERCQLAARDAATDAALEAIAAAAPAEEPKNKCGRP